MEINRFTTKLEAVATAGETLNSLLSKYKKLPVLLLLSSGSALSLLDYIGREALGENLTITVLDERFSKDAGINNFEQLQHLDFYTDALSLDCNFIGTMIRNNESMEGLAQRFEASLKKWIQENPNGKIIATIGMGRDGHTAGIFPNSDEKTFKDLFLNNQLTVSYNAGSTARFPERITTTITFLKKINHAVCLVCGTEKKEKLDEVILNRGKLHKLPALIWQEINSQIFTDINT